MVGAKPLHLGTFIKMPKAIQYSDTRDLPRDKILALYKANHWGVADRPEALHKGLINSDYVVTAWDRDRLVGLGNAISDGHLVVYYPHLLVHPNYHKRGIGKELVKRLADHYQNFHQRILVSEHHAIKFYQKCGFERADPKIPMQLPKTQS